MTAAPIFRRFFPTRKGVIRQVILTWLLSCGQKTYGLSEEHIAPLRDTLRRVKAELSLSRRAALAIYAQALRLGSKRLPGKQATQPNSFLAQGGPAGNLRGRWFRLLIVNRAENARVSISMDIFAPKQVSANLSETQ